KRLFVSGTICRLLTNAEPPFAERHIDDALPVGRPHATQTCSPGTRTEDQPHLHPMNRVVTPNLVPRSGKRIEHALPIRRDSGICVRICSGHLSHLLPVAI